MPEIKKVESLGNDLETIKALFIAYQQELGEDLCFQSFDKEMENPLEKYVDTGGLILLATENGTPCGCIALLPLEKTGVCEMKRLYVSPAFRKTGTGWLLATTLVNEAKQLGFTTMVLDTLEKLQPAIQLYQRMGFTNTTAYYHNPLKNVVYMEKQL